MMTMDVRVSNRYLHSSLLHRRPRNMVILLLLSHKGAHGSRPCQILLRNQPLRQCTTYLHRLIPMPLYLRHPPLPRSFLHHHRLLLHNRLYNLSHIDIQTYPRLWQRQDHPCPLSDGRISQTPIRNHPILLDHGHSISLKRRKIPMDNLLQQRALYMPQPRRRRACHS